MSVNRSQNHLHSTSSLPSPPLHFNNRNIFNNIQHSPSNPSPSEYSSKQLNNYFDNSGATTATSPNPAFVIDTSNLPIDHIDQYMSSNFDLQSSQGHGYPFSGSFDGPDSLQFWSSIGAHGDGVANSNQNLARDQQATGQNSRAQQHQSSPSPYQRNRVIRGRVSDQPTRKPTSLSQPFARRQSSSTGSHLPTPTQTPTQDSFLSASADSNNMYGRRPASNMNQAVAASMAMGNVVLDPNSSAGEKLPGMSHSARPSFSSVGPTPSTPLNATMGNMNNNQQHQQQHNGETSKPSSDIEAWLDQYLRYGDDSDSMGRPMVPKLERTVTDAINDELYYQAPIPVSTAATQHHLSAAQSNPMVNDLLHAAHMARSTSSNSSQSRLSPFRPESPWVSGARLRPEGRRSQGSQDLSYQTSPRTDSEPKTISPKDALLDYKPEENEMPLFPQSSSFSQPTMAAPAAAHQYLPTSSMGYGNMATSASPRWNAPVQMTTPQYPSYESFLPVGSLSMGSGFALPQDNRQAEQPEFPAHLTSMESSASEAAPPSSMASTVMTQASPKPSDSSARTGTYSCTYHGCTERFTSPQKLQKHKRDAHRKSTNITPGVGSGMSTQELMDRNSQTGPHKCERINPTTGKPCNTIFSRPYDLTRHEDTIHNVRKQKVRCALCQEEKTFSRGDALTRHMRVVHPEVDFPGKHRRRGGASP
jgi:hypothetical protein